MSWRCQQRSEHRGWAASTAVGVSRIAFGLVVGLVVGLFAGLGATGAAPAYAAGALSPSVAVPAYFWPGPEWDTLLRAGPEVRYIVLNPASGPGTRSVAEFVDVVARARAKGFTVFGYVDTAYGARAGASVEADIAKYRSWYGINQFFFDQTPSACTGVPYYAALQGFVKQSPNDFIVLNPGTNPDECYLTVSNMVVNFEGSEASYAGWTPAPYVANYGAERFWHIVYSVGGGNGAAVLTLASARNAGFVYLTDDAMPNPFDRLPTESLWRTQVPSSGAGGRNAAPQSPGGPTAGIRPAAPQASGPPPVVPAAAVPAAAAFAPEFAIPPSTTLSTSGPATLPQAITSPVGAPPASAPLPPAPPSAALDTSELFPELTTADARTPSAPIPPTTIAARLGLNSIGAVSNPPILALRPVGGPTKVETARGRRQPLRTSSAPERRRRLIPPPTASPRFAARR